MTIGAKGSLAEISLCFRFGLGYHRAVMGGGRDKAKEGEACLAKTYYYTGLRRE